MSDNLYPSDGLDQVFAWLRAVNPTDLNLAKHVDPRTRAKRETSFGVHNATSDPRHEVASVRVHPNETSGVPQWLCESPKTIRLVHLGAVPLSSWLISIDRETDWFTLADKHFELQLENPYTRLISPTMMREAVTQAHCRGAEVVTHAELSPGRDQGTVSCGLAALYISSDHDPTLILDVAEIFGGIVPEPMTGPNTVPARHAATDPDRVYFGWEWFSMFWPDAPYSFGPSTG